MKKLLSFILAAVLVFCMMPVCALQVFAESYIRNMSIQYDAEGVAVRTDLTGREVTELLKKALRSASTSEGIHVDVSCSCLAKRTGSGMVSYIDFEKLDSSDELLNADGDYYFIINTENNEGYVYDAANLPSATVNGKAASCSWYSPDFTGPDGSVDVLQKVEVINGDYVSGLKISPQRARVQQGRDFDFSAEVTGTDSRVTWSFPNGTYSSGTTVSGGHVHIGDDERTAYLAVRATSVFNPDVYDTVYIEVTDYPVAITGVTITPSPASVRRGDDIYFDVRVEGTDYLDYVTEITGAASDQTFVSGNHLHIGPEETASSIVFKVTPVVDPSKSASVTVTILPPDPVSDLIEISFDDSALRVLSPEMTGTEITSLLREAVKTAVTSECVYVDWTSCELLIRTGPGWDRTEDFGFLAEYNEPIGMGEFYLDINLEERGGWYFPDTLPSVTVNGKTADGVVWYSDDFTGPFGSIDALVKVDVFDQDTYWKMSFDANGGSGYMMDRYVEHGYPFELPECTFDPPEGKYFDYWYTEVYPWLEIPEGGELFPGSNMVFTAVWRDGEASAEIDPIVFGDMEEGYEYYDIIYEKVKVTNTGEVNLNINESSIWLSNDDDFNLIWYYVPASLSPGESLTRVYIYPEEDLPAGTYTTTVYFRDADGLIQEPVSTEVTFRVVGEITDIELINVPWPQGGNSAGDYDFSQIVHGNGYYIAADSQWCYFDLGDEEMHPFTGRFQKGNTYYMNLRFVADGNHYFAFDPDTGDSMLGHYRINGEEVTPILLEHHLSEDHRHLEIYVALLVQNNAGDNITVTPYPSSLSGTYSVSGHEVTVTSDRPVKLGYWNGTKYVDVGHAVSYSGVHRFTVPESVGSVILVVCGDANGDAKLSNADATKIKSILKADGSLGYVFDFAADANRDGKFSNADATKIKAVLKAGEMLEW